MIHIYIKSLSALVICEFFGLGLFEVLFCFGVWGFDLVWFGGFLFVHLFLFFVILIPVFVL